MAQHLPLCYVAVGVVLSLAAAVYVLPLLSQHKFNEIWRTRLLLQLSALGLAVRLFCASPHYSSCLTRYQCKMHLDGMPSAPTFLADP